MIDFFRAVLDGDIERVRSDLSANPEFVKLLLDAGADVGLRTTRGKTALEIAVEGKRQQQADPEAPETRNRAYAAVAELLRAHGV